jgi:purine-binding chemotaxis protein CheW
MTAQLINTSTEILAGAYELPELLKLINSDLTAGLRAETDDNLVVETKKKREDLGRHICIEVAGKQMAIPLSAVLEAGALQLVQSLPLLPGWLSGITNIRGEIVSVVNLALFLDRTNNSSGIARSFLLVHDDTLKIAVTVDRIVGTRSLYRSLMEPSGQGVETIVPTVFFAGRAIFDEQGAAKEIDLFNLGAFLSSHKLRNIATA